MDKLAGWVFIYNEHRKMFMAVRPEHYFELTNGDKGNVKYGKTLEELSKKL